MSATPDSPSLSIIMPVYNEAATLSRAIEEVLGAELPANVELIVVDDGSTDGTAELIDSIAAGGAFKVVHHDRNRGKGQRLIRTGLAHASGEYTAIFDADLEYDASDLGPLLEPLVEGLANAAYGVRAFDGYTSHSFLFVLGNRGVTLAANVLFNVYLHDLMTCHKLIRTEVFQSLDLRETGFAIEAEITARLLQRGSGSTSADRVPREVQRGGQEAHGAGRASVHTHTGAMSFVTKGRAG